MTLLDLPHGIHPNVHEDVYHERRLGVVSKGALDQIAKTPAHYLAWVGGIDKPATPAMIVGKAFHSLVLEPGIFESVWAERPAFGDLRTNAAKQKRDEWLAENPGKTLLDTEDWRCIHAMRDSILAHPIAAKLFVNGLAEATAIWDDDGLLCKSRMDYWREDLCVIADLKTTEDASPSAFAKSVAAYRYAVQHAHYSAGIRVLTGAVPSFLFVAVEKSPPHAVAVYQLDAESLGQGHSLRDRDMDVLEECLKTDQWPGYPTAVTSLSLPAWALKEAA